MEKGRKALLIIIAVICVVLTGIIYLNRSNNEQAWLDSLSASPPLTEPEVAANKLNESFMVHITGEVKSPGVYEVTEGSRVNDVVKMAGGVTENADLDVINLAAYVKDAEKIVIPAVKENAEGEIIPAQSGSALVNINTASLEELKTLPGVGDVIARNIISYREKNGGFKNTEEIKNVPRIGEGTYLQLCDLITV